MKIGRSSLKYKSSMTILWLRKLEMWVLRTSNSSHSASVKSRKLSQHFSAKCDCPSVARKRLRRSYLAALPLHWSKRVNRAFIRVSWLTLRNYQSIRRWCCHSLISWPPPRCSHSNESWPGASTPASSIWHPGSHMPRLRETAEMWLTATAKKLSRSQNHPSSVDRRDKGLPRWEWT